MKNPFMALIGLVLVLSAGILFSTRHSLARTGAAAWSFLPEGSKLRTREFQERLATVSFTLLGVAGVLLAVIYGLGLI